MLRSLLAIQRRIRWRRAPPRYARDTRGNFTIMSALAAPVLIVFIGMGIDYLRLERLFLPGGDCGPDQQRHAANLLSGGRSDEAYAMRGGEISDGSSRSRQAVQSQAGNRILAA